MFSLYTVEFLAVTWGQHQINNTYSRKGATVRIPPANASYLAVSGYIWQIFKREVIEALILELF
jgi:hypothetical protein